MYFQKKKKKLVKNGQKKSKMVKKSQEKSKNPCSSFITNIPLYILI